MVFQRLFISANSRNSLFRQLYQQMRLSIWICWVIGLQLSYQGARAIWMQGTSAINWLQQKNYNLTGCNSIFKTGQHQVQIATERAGYLRPGISWKKTQKATRKDPELRQQKKNQKYLLNWVNGCQEIAEEMSIFPYECHLLWERFAVTFGVAVIAELKSHRERCQRQTYYGVLDYFNHEFLPASVQLTWTHHQFSDHKLNVPSNHGLRLFGTVPAIIVRSRK